MIDMIVIMILLLILGGAALYIYRAKKAGQKCIGCPHAKACAGKCGSCNCDQ
nr:FeoB-associated Cys-rich membrane protein [Clostridia bacterium]